MSGRDHHFIPQLLQKGFSAGQTRKGKHQVWVFRRKQIPFTTSTRNSFVERDFYGPPSDRALDNDITAIEPALDRFLVEAREKSISHVLGRSGEAVTVVWHIASRARWMRDVNASFARMVFARMSGALSELTDLPGGFQTLIAHEAKSLLVTMVKEPSKHDGGILKEEESAQALELLRAIECNPALLTDIGNASAFATFAAEMQSDADVAASRAHTHFLKHHLLAQGTKLRQYLETMQWQVVVQETSDYILGDCGPLLLAASGDPLGPIGTQVFKGFGAIALPISGTHCLLGGLKPGGVVLNTAALNESTAAWSSEAFIASADTAGNRMLQALINSRIEPYLASELEGTFLELGF